jgi:cell wall-associated NlpC family hydrolase
MASSRAHAPARRLVPRVLIGLVAAGGLTLTAVPAAAEDPATSQDAAALVAARAHDLEVVTEEFNEARERLRAGQDAAARAAEDLAAAEATLATARERVRAVARGAWTGDRLGTLAAMLSSESPEELLDRAGTLQVIAEHNNGVLGGAEQATDAADRARSSAEQAAAEAQELVDRVAARQADLDRQVTHFRAEYDRLLAEEERAAREAAERAAREAAERAAREATERAAREAAEKAAAERAAAEAAERAAPATGTTGGGAPASRAAAAPPPAAPVVAGSAAAQKAVDTAMAQRGDPYVWAAAGPDAFDCSGLVQYAYAAAGVELPHSSRMQSTMGTPVSRSALQPGDLVFFYSPISHVGIYIGEGQMVHASTFGQPVKVGSVDSMPNYNSARRIAG